MGEPRDPIDYRALFRGSPVPLLVVDPRLVIVDANDAYLAATMRTREDLVGRPVFEAFPDNPDDPGATGVSALRASLRRALHERVTNVMAVQQYDIPQPGGGFVTRWWAPVSAPVPGPGGEIAYVVHRVEDVTALVVAEREQRTLDALADSLDVAVIGCDAAGRPVLSNEAARALVGDRLAGAAPEQWPDRLDLHDPDGRPLPGRDQPLCRALRGERVRDVEVVMHAADAYPRTFRMHARPVAGQTELAAVVTLHDVTMHRRTARLKECELEVARLVSGPAPADDALAGVVRLVGTRMGWTATEFWTADEVAGVLRRTTCWAAGAHHRCDGQDLLPAGEGLPGRAWKTGHLTWEPAPDGGTALAVPVPGGADVLGVLVCLSSTAEVPEEVTATLLTGVGGQLGAFLQRRRAEHLAAELGRTREEYISLVGHELRTPLTSIQAYTDLLAEDGGLTGEQRDLVQVVRRNTAELYRMVLKLLDVAGLRSGHLDVRRRTMDLAGVVRDAVEAARERLDVRAAIAVDTPATAPVDGDPDRLRQVVDELLANALTWATDGSTVGLRLHADPHATVLDVTNAGVAPRGEERAHLFDLFFRGGAARHSGLPGNGLGLALVRAIVEQHGGTVGVRDTAEATTVFSVRIPTRRR